MSLYALSKVIPVKFHTVYRENDANGQPHAVDWWQWRDRCFRVSVV